jgi:hypothetical protein
MESPLVKFTIFGALGEHSTSNLVHFSEHVPYLGLSSQIPKDRSDVLSGSVVASYTSDAEDHCQSQSEASEA